MSDESHQFGNLRLLGRRAPALLSEILAIDLASQLGSERGAEAGVLRAIEVEVTTHVLFVLRGHRQRLLGWDVFPPPVPGGFRCQLADQGSSRSSIAIPRITSCVAEWGNAANVMLNHDQFEKHGF